MYVRVGRRPLFGGGIPLLIQAPIRQPLERMWIMRLVFYQVVELFVRCPASRLFHVHVARAADAKVRGARRDLSVQSV